MSTVESLFAWAASITTPGIQDEIAVFVKQQTQAGHVYDTPENYTAAFQTFTGTVLTPAPVVPPPAQNNPNTLYGIPFASTLLAGLVKVGGGLTAAVDGTISVITATFSALGLTRQRVYNVKDYGALGDVATVFGGMANGSAVLTVGGGPFVSTDVGKVISVVGAGASGGVLNTTILSYQSATQVTLSAAASTTLALGTVIYGTDDTTSIQAAINAASVTTGEVFFPQGSYYISAPLSPTASNVRLRGAGLGASRLLWSPLASWTQGGMYFISNFYSQVGNDITGLTFDANGQNNPNFLPSAATTPTPLIWAGSRCRLTNVEGCNRPSSLGAPANGGWYVWIGGHDVTVDHCWFHDDWGGAPTVTTSPIGAAGSNISIPVGSSSGLSIFGNIVIDPSVTVYHAAAIAASGSPQTVTPRTTRENPWTNGHGSTAMRGIYVGQTLNVGDGHVLSVAVTGGGTGYTPGTYTNVPFGGGSGGTGGGALATVVVSAGGVITSVTPSYLGVGNTAAQAALSLNFTGIAGLLAGSGATFTITADLIEPVTVTATTGSTWSGVFTQAHPANYPASYTGNTETALITALPDGTHVTVTTQLNHTADGSHGTSAGNVAILPYPFTTDGVGIGHAHLNALKTEGIQISNCRMERLGLDGAGWATSKYISFVDNHVISCMMGCIPQDSSFVRIVGNTFDLSSLGLVPVGGGPTGAIYHPICLWATAPDYNTVETDIVIANNNIIGGWCGLYAIPNGGGGVVYDGVTITGNTFRGQYGNAIATSGMKNATISGNTIRNPNMSGRGSEALVGGAVDVGAILLIAGNANQTIDTIKISQNVIKDDLGHLQSCIQGYAVSGTWSTVVADGNIFSGFSHTAIQWSTVFVIRGRNNYGYNPRAGAVATPAFPSSAGGTVINTTGVDVEVHVAINGATGLTQTVKDNNGLNGAGLGAAISYLLPAFSQVTVSAYSGGPPTWVWVGN